MKLNKNKCWTRDIYEKYLKIINQKFVDSVDNESKVEKETNFKKEELFKTYY